MPLLFFSSVWTLADGFLCAKPASKFVFLTSTSGGTYMLVTRNLYNMAIPLKALAINKNTDAAISLPSIPPTRSNTQRLIVEFLVDPRRMAEVAICIALAASGLTAVGLFTTPRFAFRYSMI